MGHPSVISLSQTKDSLSSGRGSGGSSIAQPPPHSSKLLPASIWTAQLSGTEGSLSLKNL